ncbi:Response regulator receiver domain-containing protein [Actinokineospora globicatena]|nr:Response regulator receiver domain-containing protein [Actinokineospora globicatena]
MGVSERAMRVLVVDDDQDLVDLMEMCLTTYQGWDVQAVTSGTEAVHRCREHAPDAVLLDVDMPILDGPGVLAALRADPDTCAVPVVFVTGAAEPDLNQRLCALGAAAVLSKPFDPRRIGAEVALILGW